MSTGAKGVERPLCQHSSCLPVLFTEVFFVWVKIVMGFPNGRYRI